MYPRGGGYHYARRLFLMPHPLADDAIDPRTHELHEPEVRSLLPALEAGGEAVYHIGLAILLLRRAVGYGACAGGEARTSRTEPASLGLGIYVMDFACFSRSARCASGNGTLRTRMCSNRVSSDEEPTGTVEGEAALLVSGRQAPAIMINVDQGTISDRIHGTMKHEELGRGTYLRGTL